MKKYQTIGSADFANKLNDAELEVVDSTLTLINWLIHENKIKAKYLSAFVDSKEIPGIKVIGITLAINNKGKLH